ncbi:MAG: chorismate synthase [Rhabdochlamydiaceae bacterium]|nr:chorismate synthase [Rhabdochlamydiaceae bacterium]
MASNQFGNLFRITTWGESHGKGYGVVIDGCPANLPLTEEEINTALALRQPARNPYVSPRNEPDQAHIFSGVYEGKTTGTPLSIIIFNQDADSSKYEPIKDLLRPGHANFTYLKKYGIFDHRGGGRSSARETVCRVAAGAVARKLLAYYGVEIVAYTKQIAEISIGEIDLCDLKGLRQSIYDSPLFCPNPNATEQMIALLNKVKEEGDSLGGIIEAAALHLPIGLGDPVYEKLEANLAKAMLSIPATRGIEFGSGFKCANMRGSLHNDRFTLDENKNIITKTNHSGGTLGGISTGMPLVLRVPFKPTSSIARPQETLNLEGQEQMLHMPQGSRHDPCVTIRAVPVVEAMLALVLADAYLMHRSSQL